MQFSDGLAVAAIALALSGIFFGILFYKWQGELAKEMHGLLKKIEGLTTSTREQQQEHLTLALKAAVGRDRAAVAEGFADRVAAVEDRLARLGDGVSAEAKQEMDSLMAELKREVESLANDIKLLGESATSRLSSAGGRATDTPFLDAELERLGLSARVPTVLPTGLGEDILLVSVDPPAVEPGGRVTLQQVLLGLPAREAECEVLTPDGRLLTAAWPSSAASLVFPDDFPYGSTELAGTYRVTVRREELFSLTAKPGQAVFRGSFYVGSEQAE